jgi:hypothetical protein
MNDAFEQATWPDRWFQPEDAWKTIDSIYKLLLGEGHEELLRPVESIREELAAECAELLALLECAIEHSLTFKVEIEEMDNPPFKLREWADRNLAELCSEILAALQEAGIEIKEEGGND